MENNTPKDFSILLLIELKNGNIQAFRNIYDELHVVVLNYFFSKVQVREDAFDLTQDCFFRLWRYRSSISLEYQIEQQIFFISKQLLIDYYRKNNRRKYVSIDGSIEFPMEETVHNTISNDLKEELEPILNQMPTLRKDIFILNKYEGFTYREIAGHFTLSEKAVENHMYKALRFIKSKFFCFFIF